MAAPDSPSSATGSCSVSHRPSPPKVRQSRKCDRADNLTGSELAAFATEAGLTVTVCHFPPGTSKWNKIEHRLFPHITMNWRGRP